MNFSRFSHCLLVVVLACSAALADDHEYGSIAGWGQMIDPDGDCSFTVAADHVGINIPATPHDLSAELNRMNAPRVMQPVDGDFEIEALVWGVQQPELPTVENRTAYCGNGLLLMQDERNYIRLERAALSRGDAPQYYINFEQRINGQNVRFGSPQDFSLESDDEIYLKLSVKGATVTGYVKKPNELWHPLGERKITQGEPLSAGITAVNATTVPITAKFLELQISRLVPPAADSGKEESANSTDGSKTESTVEDE